MIPSHLCAQPGTCGQCHSEIFSRSLLGNIFGPRTSGNDSVRIPPCPTHGETLCSCARVPEAVPMTETTLAVRSSPYPHTSQVLTLKTMARMQAKLTETLDRMIQEELFRR